MYFQTQKPSIEDLTNYTTQAVLLTPEGPSWDPHSSSFQLNEESHLDCKGELVKQQHCDEYVFDDEDVEGTDVNAASILAMICDVNVPSDFY